MVFIILTSNIHIKDINELSLLKCIDDRLLLSTETEFLLVPASLIAVACITAAARGLRVPMSVNDLCVLTRTPAAAAELVARHVEKVLARETQPQEPRTRHSQPVKQTNTEQTQLATTPTDVQDVHF